MATLTLYNQRHDWKREEILSEEEMGTEEVIVVSEEDIVVTEEKMITEEKIEVPKEEKVLTEKDIVTEEKIVVIEEEMITEEEKVVTKEKEEVTEKDIVKEEKIVAEKEIVVNEEKMITKLLNSVITKVIIASLIKQHATNLSEIDTQYVRTKKSCSYCRLDTLLTLHTKENDECPLKQTNCNCLYPEGKKPCPSMFCSAMYDKIIEQHRFKSPDWSTTDITKWYTNFEEMAKCFLSGGYPVNESKGLRTGFIALLFISINNVFVLESSRVIELILLKKIRKAQMKILNSPNEMLDKMRLKNYTLCVMALLKTDWLRNEENAVEARKEILQYVKRKKGAEENAFRTLERRIANVEEEHENARKDIDKIKQDENTMKRQLLELNNSLQQHVMNCKIGEKDQNDDKCIKEREKEPFSKELSTRGVIKKPYTQDVDNSKEFETPVINRPLDGRLILLDNKKIHSVITICEQTVLHGGFGHVFVSKSKVPGLDVRVVIKRITCEGHERIKKLSTLNEKIAARVLHFAVVPLIAYAEEQLEGAKRAYYFLSPYLEKRSLLGLIEKDTKCSSINDVMLRCGNRIQILFQIASALDYLHTPVPGYRGIVLHMDITTMNIVLDQHLNARLIDFGLAREMNEGQREVSYTQSKSFGTPGYYPTIRYSSLTVHEDYYNFGVVIRELLTGEAPYIECGDEVSELRKSSEVVIRKTLQTLIWAGPSEYASALVKLSTQCLKSRDKKHLTASSIVKELNNILIKSNHQWRRAEADKCDLCMVNLTVEGGKAPPHRCRMKICVSCMRNSRINPIRCPTCNEEVTPEIGNTFAALLIAGNDLDNSDFAESFTREINENKDVLASKYPCVIGISDENVKTIAPSNPGKKEILLPQVSSAFEFFQERENIGTLLIYLTGHHDSKKGFVLGGPDDVLPMAKLREFLMNLCKCWDNNARILVFLDCCEPPFMDIDPDLSKDGVKIIQINACRRTEFCTQPLKGSIFQKFFVQALTRKIYNKQCYRQETLSNKEKVCEFCKMSGDFISGEQLLEYISNHMKTFVNSKEPVLSMYDVSWRDAIIGYNVDFAVDLNLKFEVQSKETIDVKLDQEMYCDIDELKLRILQNVTCCVKDVNMKLTDKFADVFSLRIHTGSDNGKELSTMLQVFAAMNTNRDIIASYRSVSHIVSGRVAMFTPTTCIYQYFDEKAKLESTGGGRKVATLSFKDLDKVTDDIQERPELKTLHETLIAVFKVWDKETNKEGKKLKVIFPCTKTENGHDLVVLDLAEKAGGISNERT